MVSNESINKLYYFCMGVLTTAIMGYVAFVQPKNKTISSQENNIQQLQKDSSLVNDSIDDLTQTYTRRIDSFDVSLKIMKRDFGHVVLATDYVLSFQTSWLESMTNLDFDGAQQSEKKGFYSLDIIEEIRSKYPIDSNDALLFSFYDKINELEKKDSL